MEAGLTDDLIYGICAFNPAIYEEIVDGITTKSKLEEVRRPEALALYLKKAFGEDFQEVFLDDLLKPLDRTRRVLLAALDEEPHPASSSDNLILALPFMEDPPRTPAAIQGLVTTYCDAIRLIGKYGRRRARAEDPDDLRQHMQWVLALLAEYGRRWELIVDMPVPVGQPFTIGVQQSRLLNLRRERLWRTVCVQRFAAGDATSAHLQARIRDHSVSIRRHRAERVQAVLRGGVVRHPKLVNVPLIQAVVHQKESYVLYTSHTERPFYIDVVLGLALTGYVAWTLWTVLVLALLSLAATAALPGADAQSVLAAEAVVTIPVTIAAALVLVREQSALSATMQSWQRGAVCVLVGLLWLLATARAFTALHERNWPLDWTINVQGKQAEPSSQAQEGPRVLLKQG